MWVSVCSAHSLPGKNRDTHGAGRQGRLSPGPAQEQRGTVPLSSVSRLGLFFGALGALEAWGVCAEWAWACSSGPAARPSPSLLGVGPFLGVGQPAWSWASSTACRSLRVLPPLRRMPNPTRWVLFSPDAAGRSRAGFLVGPSGRRAGGPGGGGCCSPHGLMWKGEERISRDPHSLPLRPTRGGSSPPCSGHVASLSSSSSSLCDSC